jgi:hypothetical protein
MSASIFVAFDIRILEGTKSEKIVRIKKRMIKLSIANLIIRITRIFWGRTPDSEL